LPFKDSAKWPYLSVTFSGIICVVLHTEVVSESGRGGHCEPGAPPSGTARSANKAEERRNIGSSLLCFVYKPNGAGSLAMRG